MTAMRSSSVLVLAPQPFLSHRGTPLATLNLVKTLISLGHHVTILTFPRGTNVAMGGLQHVRSWRIPVGPVRPGPSLAKFLLDIPFFVEAGLRVLLGTYDAVHAIEEAVLVWPAARAQRIPLIADVDSWIPEQLKESGFMRHPLLLGALTRLYRSALGESSLVLTPCSSLTERVRREVPEAPVVQLEDLPLQVAEGSSDDQTQVDRLESRLQASNMTGLRRVAYCGNFERQQGVSLLVAAAARCRGAFFIFGGGTHGQIAALESEARHCEVQDRCLFLGPLTPREAVRLLEIADIVVIPRLGGSHTGFKLATCMATGKPLVATRIPAHTQVLNDGLAGLVDPTPEGIAAGIDAVLADPTAAAARAARAKDYAERHFSATGFRRRVSDAYERVLSDNAQRRAVKDPWGGRVGGVPDGQSR